MSSGFRKGLTLIIIFLAVFLSVRYLLPLCLPFLLGAALALAAEPIVRFLSAKVRLPRALAAGIGVSMSFCFLALLVMVLCAFAIRELKQLAGILPDLENAARAGMTSMEDWLLNLAAKAPDGIRTLVTENVTQTFSGGSAFLDRVTDWLLGLASGMISRVPDRFLSIGTGIISSFMISAKLPQLKEKIKTKFPKKRLQSFLAALSRLKTAVGGWLKAQLKLSAVTYAFLTVGFLILGVSYGPLWAAPVALVDALPVLGTGTVLVPWSVISFLQGDRIRAFGLLGLYAAVTLARSVLEPRLVGRQLGLDPLATLIALYVGYQLWGIGGMLLAPLLAVMATQLVEIRNDKL